MACKGNPSVCSAMYVTFPAAANPFKHSSSCVLLLASRHSSEKKPFFACPSVASLQERGFTGHANPPFWICNVVGLQHSVRLSSLLCTGSLVSCSKGGRACIHIALLDMTMSLGAIGERMVKEKSLAMTVRYHLNMTISLGAIGERMVKEKSLAMTVRYHLNDTKK
jgi:hypothetical protein